MGDINAAAAAVVEDFDDADGGGLTRPSGASTEVAGNTATTLEIPHGESPA
ncbi:hypothetical protein [Mycobacterium sp.]|uniref:hypothetical protein n=1 Tax=Mycobacterium sp. TaxID=1785 RepID=UPI003F9AD2E4